MLGFSPNLSYSCFVFRIPMGEAAGSYGYLMVTNTFCIQTHYGDVFQRSRVVEYGAHVNLVRWTNKAPRMRMADEIEKLPYLEA